MIVQKQSSGFVIILCFTVLFPMPAPQPKTTINVLLCQAPRILLVIEI